MKRRDFAYKFLAMLGAAGVATRATASKELSKEEIVKAWEDPAFRKSLSAEQWEAMPFNPAGEIKAGQFDGNMMMASGNGCSGNGCSGNGCSGNGCSGNGCSGNGCSGNGCSGNGCSGNGCSGNGCSGNGCSGNSCGSAPYS